MRGDLEPDRECWAHSASGGPWMDWNYAGKDVLDPRRVSGSSWALLRDYLRLADNFEAFK